MLKYVFGGFFFINYFGSNRKIDATYSWNPTNPTQKTLKHTLWARQFAGPVRYKRRILKDQKVS